MFESVSLQDLYTVGFLVFLEGILSIDNAVVLALLAKDLPEKERKKALTYGMVGAFAFRFISLFLVTYLMKWRWVKFVGGGYLLYVALKHFLAKKSGQSEEEKKAAAHKESAADLSKRFWRTVIVIELTDIAFAVDSILAAVAVTQKFGVVLAGGILGIILMRFAASVFLKILERFPAFETSAYLLVSTIGAKLVIDGFHFEGVDFHSSSSPAFWIFWIVMALCLLYGFRPKPKS